MALTGKISSCADFKTVLLFSTALSFLAVPAYAQQAPDDGEVTPIIEVVGIRASLETALEERKKSDVIQDGISADDVGSTPDLNLGEALQRIPGVQINRSDERRNATISVRGLPGSLTKTTVIGQNVASASISFNSPGTPGSSGGNPFGIFDASLFSGANIIKSFTADLPAGGLGANADLRLRSALSRKNSLVLRAELGYEETTEDALPSIFGTFSRKITDNFGVYVTGSWRKEGFRRDSININGYGGSWGAARATQFGATPTAPGIPVVLIGPADIRQFVLANEGSRLSAGAGLEWKPSDEVSIRLDGIYTKRNLDGAINDIFQVNLQDFDNTVTPVQRANGSYDISYLGQQDRNGVLTDVYVANNFNAVDARVSAGNRVNSNNTSVWAIYPQVNFKNDSWNINLTGTISRARAQDRELQYNFDFREVTATPTISGITIPTGAANAPYLASSVNGTTVAFSSGLGNFNNYALNVSLPANAFLSGPGAWTISNNGIQAFYQRPSVTATTANRGIAVPAATVAALPTTAAGNALRNLLNANGGFLPAVRLENRLTVTGTERSADRNLYSLDFSIEKYLNLGPFTAFEIGGRWDDESSVRLEQRNSIYGLRVQNVNDSVLQLNSGVTSGGTFFGGQVPGVEIDNFLSVNIPALTNLLLPPGTALLAPGTIYPVDPVTNQPLVTNQILAANAVGGPVVIDRVPARLINSISGLYNQPSLAFDANNFVASRSNYEAFAMTKFDLREISELPVRGNFGLRYAKTTVRGITNADFFSTQQPPLEERERSFDAWLPSANVIIDFTDKLVGRLAYYHTFESLDLTEIAPTRTTVQIVPSVAATQTTPANPGSVTIIFDSFGSLESRTSKAFDAGISWYNRAGSVISLGYFHKEVKGFIDRAEFCDAGGVTISDGTISGSLTTGGPSVTLPYTSGDLFLDSQENCRIQQNITPEDQNRDFNLRRLVVVPDTIPIDGFEFQIQQNLSFLPGFWKGFGGIFNATRVKTGEVNGRRFFNVADWTYNLIGYYEDALISARAAYNWQSEIQLTSSSTFNRGDRTVRPRGQLDISFAMRPAKSKNFEIRLEGFNLTNSRREEYEVFEQLNRRADYDGRTYSLSMQYKF
jgi:iron complex outermembrane recepter protein